TRRSMLPSSQFCIFKRSRTELYFAGRPDLLAPYTSAAEAIRQSGCANVGITPILDAYEYPMLVLLGDENGGRAVKHVQVAHPSKVYDQNQPAFKPCAVVCMDSLVEFVKAYEGRADSAQRFQGMTIFFSKAGFSP